MIGGRGAATAVAAIAVAAAGCGFGAGETSSGTATLTVTRDFGSEALLEASESDPAESETVIRFLDREAEITTRYGGGFVQSIDGISGELDAGRSLDWFFFVNGIESPRGGADVQVRGGDRIWWDYRDWTAAMRAPAVVGSWPEPFAQASTPAADRSSVEVDCAAAATACDQVTERLEAEGVRTTAAPDAGELPRLLVGPWPRIGGDRVADDLGRGPATSGVFARFERGRGGAWELEELDRTGAVSRSVGAGAGLVAALRPGDGPPTWLITGTDARGVARAASTLAEEELENRYAVAVGPAGVAALPLEPAP